jgi:ComF family protein
MKNFYHKLLSIETWLDALLPSRCAACNAISNLKLICSRCERAIVFSNSNNNTSEIESVFSYSSAVKKIIIEAKFCRNENKARALISYCFTQTFQGNFLEKLASIHFDAVCFVPIHWRRRLWRGFDLSVLFAIEVAGQLRLPLLDLLISKRLDKPLTLAHSKTEREKITKDRFSIKKSQHSPLELLLIDDVTTTGSTLRSAMDVLQRSGHKVRALTLAKAPDKLTENERIKPDEFL